MQNRKHLTRTERRQPAKARRQADAALIRSTRWVRYAA